MSWTPTSLADALSTAKVFVDGDWVESKDQDPEGDVRLIQLADVGDGCYVDKSNRFLTSSAANRLKCTFLESGDILIARMPDPLGRACIFPGDTKRAVTVVDVCIIRVDPERMYAPWLVHCINSSISRSQIAGYVTGTTRQRISRGNLGKIQIAVPPLPEQRRIAAILDQADALRAKRREALAQLDSLTQSIFIEMFGDPAVGTPKSAVYPLESLLEESFQNGAYFQKEVYCEEGGVEMVHMSDAFGGTVLRGKLRRVSCDANDVQKYSLGKEDILIARRSLTYEGAAKPCMIPNSTDPLIFESSFIRIKADKTRITPLYLFHYLNNERVRQKHVRPYVTQSTISGINQSNLAQVPVMQPPLEQQKEFGSRIAAVEALKNVHLISLTQLDSLFASLQHRAFRGEL